MPYNRNKSFLCKVVFIKLNKKKRQIKYETIQFTKKI